MDSEELYQKLLDASFRYLAIRPRSEKEFNEYIDTKMVRYQSADSEVKNKVASRMRELGYIDDYKFAAWWVDQRTRVTPRGRILISYELRAKGVDREVIDQVLSQNTEQPSEMEAAKSLLTKKMSVLTGLPPKVRKEKIYRLLLARGFSAGVVRSIVDEELKKD
jgi:regulatory protein